MKGALLKEFYVWRKTGLAYALMYVALGLVYFFIGNLSGVLLGFMLGGINRIFIDDEKNNWNDYSRVLPYSTAHRVSARYIIILCEIVVALIVTTLMNVFEFYNDEQSLFVGKYFEYLSVSHISVSSTVLNIAVVLAGIAFSVPINYIFKGTKRTVIGMIPIFFVILIIVASSMMFALPYAPGEKLTALLKIFYYEKWVIPVLLAISVAMLAISWIISIVINTNSGKDKLKKFKITAVILVAAIVAASAVTVGILYKNGRFEKDETDYYDYYISSLKGNTEKEKEPYKPSKEQLECREDAKIFIEEYLKESFVGKPLETGIDWIESLGYKETEYGDGEYEKGSDQAKIRVRFYTEENSDTISVIDVAAGIGDSNYIEKATKAEMDKLCGALVEGMAENEALEFFEKQDFRINGIREYSDPDYGTVRYYMVQCYVAEYNGGEYVRYSMNVEAADGKVFDVRIYVN